MYAVVDTETTGLSPKAHHRIAEIAVVLVDSSGRLEGEWCTLVNPGRDLGPQHIHRIRAVDAAAAPSFESVAGHVLKMLSGRAIVAHNLAFDLLFLRAEYSRLNISLPDTGICTMKWSKTFLPGAGRSLSECCSAASVSLIGWHSALADARATAGLLRCYIPVGGRDHRWTELVGKASKVQWPSFPVGRFSVRGRDISPIPHAESRPFVARLTDYLPRVSSPSNVEPYLVVLDEALADRYLSADENGALRALAESLDISASDVAVLHSDYLDALARIATADGQVSDEERADLNQIAEILALGSDSVQKALDAADADQPRSDPSSLPIKPGDTVVFTGTMDEPRDVWIERAREHGYVHASGVTRSVGMVVAADTHSLSGKAKKARGYGIPIMNVAEFRAALGYPRPARAATGQARPGATRK